MPQTASFVANVFKAEATGEQARIWHHLFKALARVGNDLFLQVNDKQISMHTLNQAHSAFATVSFPDLFFKDFSVSGKIESCKILLKSMSAVFKFPANVEEFFINFDCDKSDLTITLTCRDGITKRFHVQYEQAEVMQAVYDKTSPNSATLSKAQPLLQCLGSFGHGVEEVTMKVKSETIDFSSFTLGLPDFGGDKAMQTTTSFNPRQLHRYKFEGEPAVTFAIKELREIVGFCDKIAMGISLRFSDPGMPIIFRAERQDDDQNFELDLILATIDCQDGPPKERVAAGRASVHTSQEVSSHRESDCSDDQRHRRGSMQAGASQQRPTGNGKAAEEEEGVRGGRLDASARQSSKGRGRESGGRERGGKGGDGRESMEHFTHDSIVSAATSDQQESFYSMAEGDSSFQSRVRENSGSLGLEREHKRVDEEGREEGGARLSVSQESESQVESSAMASMLSMPSAPPARRPEEDDSNTSNTRKTKPTHRPSVEEWMNSAVSQNAGDAGGAGRSCVDTEKKRGKERETGGSQRSDVRGGSSHRPIQRAGSKRMSPDVQDSDDPYSDVDDDDEIVKATPSPPE